jgi:hypothetical protein
VRVSYLLSFLCCGRKGSVFLIYLVFCVAVDGERVSHSNTTQKTKKIGNTLPILPQHRKLRR